MTILVSELYPALKALGVATGGAPAPSGALLAVNNLSDVPDKPLAITNLGLGSAATRSVTSVASGSVASIESLAAITPGHVAVYSDSAGTLTDTGYNPTEWLLKSGGAMTGALTLAGDPTAALQAATKQYVDAQVSGGLTPVYVSTNTTLVANRRYYVDSSAGQILLALPASWAFNDQIEIIGVGSLITGGGWAVICNAGQRINGGGTGTPAGGAILTDYPRDCVTLVAQDTTTLKAVNIQSRNLRTNLGAAMNQLNLLSPVPVTDGGTGLATIDANKVLVGAGDSPAIAKSIAGGAGISVTQSPTTITIAQTQANIGQTLGVSSDTLIDCGVSYVTQSPSLITFTLPATCAFGDIFEIIGDSAGGWRIDCGVGQSISLGDVATSVAAISTKSSDSVRVKCVQQDTRFTVVSTQGDIDLL